MRWLLLLSLLAAAAAPAHAEDNPDLGARLVTWYGQKRHYKQVKREVLVWHKTTRNACVAFVSTALRDLGVDIPEDAEVDGEAVSRLTLPFSRWLEEHLGWSRVTAVDDLRPGDVVFTEQPEYPWHVYVFHSWQDEGDHLAYVLDNQGFLHVRDVLGTGPGNFTPFAYALRP